MSDMQTDRHFHSYRNATTTLTKLKKKKLKYVFRSVCDEVWLEIPTFAYIYIYVSLTVVRSFPLPNVAHQSCKLIALCSLACSAMPICFMSTIRGKEGASKPHVFVWKETKHYLLQWDHRDHSVLWGWLDFRNSNKILNDRKTDDLL